MSARLKFNISCRGGKLDRKVKLKQPKTPRKLELLQEKWKDVSGELTKSVQKVAIKAKNCGT